MAPRLLHEGRHATSLVAAQPAVDGVGFAAPMQASQGHRADRLPGGDFEQRRRPLAQVGPRFPIPQLDQLGLLRVRQCQLAVAHRLTSNVCSWASHYPFKLLNIIMPPSRAPAF